MAGDFKVNLFIVGAAKAGTTTLYSLLSGHRQVCMSHIKEPNYFSASWLKSEKLYYKEPVLESHDDYRNCFSPDSSAQIIGEASVSYLFYPGTAQKIAEYNPSARIIIILRNPAERAFSHYMMDKKLGYSNTSFEDVWKSKGTGPLAARYKQYFLYGLYSGQVEQYLLAFPKEQVLILWFEDLKNNIHGVIRQLTGFLKLNENGWPVKVDNENKTTMAQVGFLSLLYRIRSIRKMIKAILPKQAINFIKQRWFNSETTPIPPHVKTALTDYYRDDIRKLESITGKSLSHWYE